jgi:hypothetical protein
MNTLNLIQPHTITVSGVSRGTPMETNNFYVIIETDSSCMLEILASEGWKYALC